MLGGDALVTWRFPLLVCEMTKDEKSPQPMRAEALASMCE